MHDSCRIAMLLVVMVVVLPTALRAEKVTLQQGVDGYAGFEDTATDPEGKNKGEEGLLGVGLWGSKMLIRFDVSALAGRTVRLYFAMRSADLYAFQFVR